MLRRVGKLGIGRAAGAWTEAAVALEAAAIAAARRNDIALWYAPIGLVGVFQEGAGTTPANLGDVVGLIRDSQYGRGGIGGSGYGASQATASRRPTVVQFGSGRAAARYDGVDDRLIGPVANAPAVEFMCVAGSVRTSDTANALIGRRNGATGLMIRREATANALAAIVFDGTTSQSIVMGQPAAGERFVATVMAKSGGSKAWANGIPAGVLLTTFAPAVNTINVGIGSERGNAAASSLDGDVAFAAYGTTEPPEADRIAIERFAAFLAAIPYRADVAPTLFDIAPFNVSATKWVSIPYLDRGWAEPTAGDAQWNAVLDAHLPAGTPPAGGWPVVCWFHPNGQSRTIADGSDAALNMRDPLLAAGYAVFSIEFAHPIVCKAALGSGYTDAYNDIGRAVQKVRSLSEALGLNPARVAGVAQSRGSLSIYTTLMADRKQASGTHQDRQSSLMPAMYVINGQTAHRSATTATEYVIEADRAGFLVDYPDDPAAFDAINMVATAPQVPDIHLVHDRAYYASQQPRANVEGDVHYPDFHLTLKQRYQAAGHGSKVTDAPSTLVADRFNAMVSWIQARV